MSDLSMEMAVGLILVAIFLSITFTIGLMHYFEGAPQASEQIQVNAPTSGDVSLTLLAAQKTTEDENGEVSLMLLSPGG